MRLIRFYRILRTLLRFGLLELIPEDKRPWWLPLFRISFFWVRPQYKNKSEGARLRLALEELGPVFVKLGQMLSTRRDLLPLSYVDELAKLQDQVAPFPGRQALQAIEKSLGQPVETAFYSFSIEPLASASIAQVHAAELLNPKTGNVQQVVVKVIRPGILKIIQADIRLMEGVARLAAKVLPDGKRLKPVEVIREYKKTLMDELNLAREAGNAIQLKRNFENSELLYIPEVYSEFTRENILVMERIDGIPVSDLAQIEAEGIDVKLLAERGVEVFFTQVFRDSFFHADMHPGNIFVDRTRQASPRYLAVDFGIVGTLNKEDKRYLAENFIAFFNRDYRKVAELHVRSGWVPPHVDIEAFESEIRTVCEPIFEKPLAEISFAHVLLHLFSTARRFEMAVQPQLVLLQKTLLYVEGLGRNLYPQLDLWKTAKPFLERWMKEQMGWRALKRNLAEQAPQWVDKLPELPLLAYETLQQLKQQHQYQQAYWAQAEKQQKVKAKGLWWLAFASVLSIFWGASLVLQYPGPFTLVAGVVSSLSWLVSWRILSRS